MGHFDSEDVLAMGHFDFIGLLKILRDKGYELSLYAYNRDEIHIQLTDWDRDTGCAFNVKEIVSLSSIERYKCGPNYALCDIFLRLMEQLDGRAQSFTRHAERVELSDGKET